MKRIIITFAAVALAAVVNAQMLFNRSTDIEFPRPMADTVAVSDSAAVADSLWWAEESRTTLEVGLAAGVMLYSNDNELTPYYSTHGLVLEVPIMMRWRVSPHWRLSTGARLDFTFNPLHYNVGGHEVDDGNGYTYADGLDFQETFNGKQHYFTYFFHLGIPVQATWYPWPHEKRLLSVTGDLFAGYALGNDIFLNRSYADRNGGSTGIDDVHQVSHHVESLLRWKLEVGVTLSTDVLGLIHGVRFFANLLPSYRDPVTGSDLYLAGMTVYL